MNTSLTYTERAAIADAKTDAARFTRITELFHSFKSRGHEIERDTIAAVNLGREIGLELQGIVGAEQMGFGFYTTHCADKLPFAWEATQRFIAIARKAPLEVTTMAEAAPVMQQVMFAAELLQLPEARTNPQESHDSTPYTFVVNTLGSAWEKIENRMRDVAKWDPLTKSSVRNEIERFERKAGEIKAKL